MECDYIKAIFTVMLCVEIHQACLLLFLYFLLGNTSTGNFVFLCLVLIEMVFSRLVQL